MNDDQFEAFLEQATAELLSKQDVLKNQYGMGTHKRWWYDQNKETLQFFDADDNVVIAADVIDIGSYAQKAGTWKWAWANETVAAPARAKSARLQDLQGITGYSIFGREEAFAVDEYMAWEIAAVSVQHLGALGCYRALSPARGINTFLAIMAVKQAS